MSVIEVKNLSKTFKSKVKGKGLGGSIKSIFCPKYKTVKAVKKVRGTLTKDVLNELMKWNNEFGALNQDFFGFNIIKIL